MRKEMRGDNGVEEKHEKLFGDANIPGLDVRSLQGVHIGIFVCTYSIIALES